MFVVYSFVTMFQVHRLEPVAFAQNAVGYERRPGWGASLARMLAKKAFVLGYSRIAAVNMASTVSRDRSWDGSRLRRIGPR